MPIIRLEEGVSLIVPQDFQKLVDDSKELTEKLVLFLNSETEDYSASATALAIATALFLKGVRETDEEVAEETRNAILEIVSEGR
jgi:hypothetical protein